MPESEFNEQFFEQFLDDYYAESDEHLRSVRHNLLAIEDSFASGQALEKPALNELFRSFHTIKGISAMANVGAAETLAHSMENYLRMLRDGQAGLTEEGLNALIDSTNDWVYLAAPAPENPYRSGLLDADQFEAMRLNLDEIRSALSIEDGGPADPTLQADSRRE